MKETIDSPTTQEEIDIMGDAHAGSAELTPLRSDAFDLSDEEKLSLIHI